jgi:hypothetical protein
MRTTHKLSLLPCRPGEAQAGGDLREQLAFSAERAKRWNSPFTAGPIVSDY